MPTNLVLDDNTSITPSLNSLCDNYTTDFLTLVPVPHWEEVGGVSDNGSQSLLSHLQILLTDPVFDQNPSPLPWQLFQNYLTELVRDADDIQNIYKLLELGCSALSPIHRCWTYHGISTPPQSSTSLPWEATSATSWRKWLSFTTLPSLSAHSLEWSSTLEQGWSKPGFSLHFNCLMYMYLPLFPSFLSPSLPLSSSPSIPLFLYLSHPIFFLLSSSSPSHFTHPRHLGNWEWFRSALTVTFAVLVFLGSLCLLGALVQGLYNVLAIYRYSEDSAYDHAAHQAGLFIKK